MGTVGRGEDARQVGVEMFDVHVAAAVTEFTGQEFGEAGRPFPD
ncbi:hypothetical protein ABT300_31070 [Streptomyces sp. NPDC001027]